MTVFRLEAKSNALGYLRRLYGEVATDRIAAVAGIHDWRLAVGFVSTADFGPAEAEVT